MVRSSAYRPLFRHGSRSPLGPTRTRYNAITRGEAPFHATSPVAALEAAYARDEDDEFVQPTAIHNGDQRPVVMAEADAAIFMNFRADRARQLTRAMTEADFDGFQRRSFVQLSIYDTDPVR